MRKSGTGMLFGFSIGARGTGEGERRQRRAVSPPPSPPSPTPVRTWPRQHWRWTTGPPRAPWPRTRARQEASARAPRPWSSCLPPGALREGEAGSVRWCVRGCADGRARAPELGGLPCFVFIPLASVVPQCCLIAAARAIITLTTPPPKTLPHEKKALSRRLPSYPGEPLPQLLRITSHTDHAQLDPPRHKAGVRAAVAPCARPCVFSFHAARAASPMCALFAARPDPPAPARWPHASLICGFTTWTPV